MQTQNEQTNPNVPDLVGMLNTNEFAQLRRLIEHDPLTASRIVETLEQKMTALSNNDFVGAKQKEDALIGYFDAQYAKLVRDRIIHTASEVA